MDEYQKFIHKSRYARYLDSEGRRETWEETVDRYCRFWENTISHKGTGHLGYGDHAKHEGFDDRWASPGKRSHGWL